MTFSILARCPRTGMLGVATSSKALATGGIVPYCRAGVGAVASQSFANPYLGIDGLRFLEQGLTSERALERLIESDRGRDLRVDDHPDPIPELRRVFELFQREEAPLLPMMPRRDDYTPQWEATIRMQEMLEASLEEEAATTRER